MERGRRKRRGRKATAVDKADAERDPKADAERDPATP